MPDPQPHLPTRCPRPGARRQMVAGGGSHWRGSWEASRHASRRSPQPPCSQQPSSLPPGRAGGASSWCRGKGWAGGRGPRVPGSSVQAHKGLLWAVAGPCSQGHPQAGVGGTAAVAVGFAGPALVLACWPYQAHRGEGWPGPWAGQRGGGLSPQEPREEPVDPALGVTSRGSGLGAAGPRGPGGMWAVLGGVGQPGSLERVEGGDGSQRVAQVPEWAGESRPRGRRKAEGWGRGRDGRSPRARLPETSAHLTDGDSEAQGVPGPCPGLDSAAGQRSCQSQPRE